MQDGKNDLNLYAGSWYIANQDVASALEYAGYDSTFVVGTEGHNGKHGSAILPDALRWLWRDYPEADREIARWRRAPLRHHDSRSRRANGKSSARATSSPKVPAVDRNGNVFFTDIPNNRIHKIDTGGKVTVFKED